jgi:hypothetical protein
METIPSGTSLKDVILFLCKEHKIYLTGGQIHSLFSKQITKPPYKKQYGERYCEIIASDVRYEIRKMRKKKS